MTKEDALNELVEEILQSSKYRFVCNDAIQNIGRTELPKRRSLKVVVKPRWIFIELKVNVRGGIYAMVRRYWSRTAGDDIEKALQGL